MTWVYQLDHFSHCLEWMQCKSLSPIKKCSASKTQPNIFRIDWLDRKSEIRKSINKYIWRQWKIQLICVQYILEEKNTTKTIRLPITKREAKKFEYKIFVVIKCVRAVENCLWQHLIKLLSFHRKFGRDKKKDNVCIAAGNGAIQS